MIFPSYIFLLVFLPLVLALWLSRLPLKLRLTGLTLASYFFYAWWDWRFVSLLAFSTALDYLCGRVMVTHDDSPSWRRTALAASLIGNLGVLGVFKYYDFFALSLAEALAGVGWRIHPALLHVVLPVGISFYTFQSLSYSLDIYRRRVKPAPDLFHFAAYVSLFPQLVAGPIVRYAEMDAQLAQLADRGRVSNRELSFGAWLFILGLFKKIFIADQLAPLAAGLFDVQGAVHLAEGWLGALAYTFQLYFDFSGYSDMAIGLGLMLGFRFPINFNSPYKSVSIGDFWRRWHISLSHFLRDYVYIPLGGSRAGRRRTVISLGLTFFLCGLWHGAGWVFVVWGMYHGALVIGRDLWRWWVRVRIPTGLSWLLTMLAVVVGWVVFRSPDLARAGEILSGMVGLNGLGPGFEAFYSTIGGLKLPVFVVEQGGMRVLGMVALAFCLAVFGPNSTELKKSFHPVWGLGLGLTAALVVLNLAKETPFLYFQF